MSVSEIVDASYDAEKARGIIHRYEGFIAQYKDVLDASQLIYSQSCPSRQLSDQQIQVLEPFPALVNQDFEDWLKQKRADFSAEQTQCMERIKQQIVSNGEFDMEDFDGRVDCRSDGGLLKARALFGNDLPVIVQELNGVLIA